MRWVWDENEDDDDGNVSLPDSPSCYVSYPLRWPLSFISLEPLLIGLIAIVVSISVPLRAIYVLVSSPEEKGANGDEAEREDKGIERIERRCLLSFFSTRKKRQQDKERKDKIELQSSLRFLLSFLVCSSFNLSPLNSVVSSFPDFWYYLLPKCHLVGDKQKQAMPFVPFSHFLFFSFHL